MAKFPPPDGHRSPCSVCKKEMLFAQNLDTHKTGPLDIKAVVYVLRLDVPSNDVIAQTADNFLDEIELVRLKDGTSIPANKLRFYVSHFATCSRPDLFSKGK